MPEACPLSALRQTRRSARVRRTVHACNFPSALTLLCAVQGCERFAFTAILPLFVLYLHHRHGFTEPTALLIIGLFTALSYASGLPGGMLTDRRLGPRSGLLIGSVLLMLG